MSESAEEIAQHSVQAWEGPKPELFLQHCDPDVEFLLPRNLLEGGCYRGHEGVRRAFSEGFETWESFSLQIKAVREVGDQLVVLYRSQQQARHGGPRVDYDVAYIFKMREGRIVHARPFLDHQEALEAAGVSE